LCQVGPVLGAVGIAVGDLQHDAAMLLQQRAEIAACGVGHRCEVRDAAAGECACHARVIRARARFVTPAGAGYSMMPLASEVPSTSGWSMRRRGCSSGCANTAASSTATPA